MSFALRIVFGPAVLSTFLAPLAHAQNTLDHSVECASGEVNVTIEMALDTALPQNLVSLELVRSPLSTCQGDVVVQSWSTALARGAHAFFFRDAPGEGMYRYDLQLRDDTGAVVDTYPTFALGDSPHVQDDDYAYCGSPGIVGELRAEGWHWVLEGCASSCQPTVNIDFLPGLLEFAGVSGTWRLEGAFSCTFEGCWFGISSFEAASCTAVPIEESGWGTLKSRFRP